MNTLSLVPALVLAAFVAVVCPQEPATQLEPAKGPALLDLEAVHAAVRRTVLRHWPDARTELRAESPTWPRSATIVFEHAARPFLVHHLQKTGEWEDRAEEVRGPRPGGVYCEMRLEVRRGEYMGARRTGAFDELYYLEHRYAPYWAAQDRAFWVELRLPARGPMGRRLEAPKAFVDDFERLLGELAAGPKPKDTTLTVMLTNPGEDKVALIKVVGELTHLGLEHAKGLVEASAKEPVKLLDKLSPEQATAARAALEKAGGRVEVR